MICLALLDFLFRLEYFLKIQTFFWTLEYTYICGLNSTKEALVFQPLKKLSNRNLGGLQMHSMAIPNIFWEKISKEFE